MSKNNEIDGPGVEPVSIHQWRKRPQSDAVNNPWFDDTKGECYSRIDQYYEARTLYLAAPSAPVQAVPDGWPTPEMLEAAWVAYRDSNRPSPFQMIADAVRAAIAAAPQPPKEIEDLKPSNDREWAAQPADLREGCTKHIDGVGDI